ncbi:MAG TPA: hypothetical protein VH599_20290 [Ktedonobacterales bacterium]
MPRLCLVEREVLAPVGRSRVPPGGHRCARASVRPPGQRTSRPTLAAETAALPAATPDHWWNLSYRRRPGGSTLRQDGHYLSKRAFAQADGWPPRRRRYTGPR